jgi:hypothetical protein
MPEVRIVSGCSGNGSGGREQEVRPLLGDREGQEEAEHLRVTATFRAKAS